MEFFISGKDIFDSRSNNHTKEGLLMSMQNWPIFGESPQESSVEIFIYSWEIQFWLQETPHISATKLAVFWLGNPSVYVSRNRERTRPGTLSLGIHDLSLWWSLVRYWPSKLGRLIRKSSRNFQCLLQNVTLGGFCQVFGPNIPG